MSEGEVIDYEDLKREYKSAKFEMAVFRNRLVAEGKSIGGKDFKMPDEQRLLRRKIKNMESRILGFSESFDDVRCWMVDVVSDHTTGAKMEDMEQVLREFMASHSGVDHAGGLAQAVRAFLEKEGFHLTDSGYGSVGWHLGCHCTELEARGLCEKVSSVFAAAIKRGLIHIRRMSWSLGFIEKGGGR